MPALIGDELRTKGWKAGAVLPSAMVADLKPYLTRDGQSFAEIGESDWIVVVSQTCDVVQPNLDKEPLVEVLHCRPIDQLRGEFKECKSTRVLDFRPNRNAHVGIVLSAHAISDRYVIPRDLFAKHGPDPGRVLSESSVKNIQLWYAFRYSRPAWPNAFVERIGGTRAALVKILKPLKDDVAEVRVAIAENDRELAEDEHYHIAVYFVVDQDVWNADIDGRQSVYRAFNNFVSKLGACKGIEVNEELSGVFDGGSFTWQLTKASDEWNFANLSQVD